MAELAIQRVGVRFQTPVVLASGPAGLGHELHGQLDFSRIGAITAKTLTPEPGQGNPQPRLVDCPSGALNSIGLENPGIEAFLQHDLGVLQSLDCVRILSLAATTESALAEMAEPGSALPGIDLLELNLSCPNAGNRIIGADPSAVASFTREVTKVASVPVLVKLPGDSGDFMAAAAAALENGAAGLTLINTLRGTRIDWTQGKPFLKRVYGGLCGPAILPIALARVYEAREAFPDALIVGTGGVVNLSGLLEMLMAGADLVGIGFGLMADPELPQRLAGELTDWLDVRGLDAVEQLIGLAHKGGFSVH